MSTHPPQVGDIITYPPETDAHAEVLGVTEDAGWTAREGVPNWRLDVRFDGERDEWTLADDEIAYVTRAGQ